MNKKSQRVVRAVAAALVSVALVGCVTRPAGPRALAEEEFLLANPIETCIADTGDVDKKCQIAVDVQDCRQGDMKIKPNHALAEFSRTLVWKIKTTGYVFALDTQDPRYDGIWFDAPAGEFTTIRSPANAADPGYFGRQEFRVYHDVTKAPPHTSRKYSVHVLPGIAAVPCGPFDPWIRNY